MINNQYVNADTVDVLSDIISGCDVRYNRSDIINHVWDVIYRAQCAIYTVGVIS